MADDKELVDSSIWESDVDLETHFASDIAISFSGSYFMLVFGENLMHLPAKDGESRNSYVKPVSRIAIPVGVMPNILEAMMKNFSRHVQIQPVDEPVGNAKKSGPAEEGID